MGRVLKNAVCLSSQVSGAVSSGLENRPRAHRGAPACVVMMVVMVMRLRSLRRMQKWRGGLQV